MSLANPHTDCKYPSTNPLLRAALWYAGHGYYVLPLHSPVFDAAGSFTGCSCTNPACEFIGKHPQTINGVKDATRNKAKIMRWWEKWPNANIGIAAGASGLIILDFDGYKAGAQSPADVGADENTIITETPSGGLHLWYRQPETHRLGNTEGVGAGINVRGHNGYVLAPPSIGANGKLYKYREGHKPSISVERDPMIAKLPAPILQRILARKAQGAPHGAKITFSDNHPARPNLTRWNLKERVLGLIVQGAPKGSRSEAAMAVCRALLETGATADDVRAVMLHYPIGEKYREKGHGDRWLSLTLSKINLGPSPAQAADAGEPMIDPVVAALPALLCWVESADCVKALRAAGIRRAADYQKALWAIVYTANQRHTKRLELSTRQLALLTCRSHMAMSRYRTRLVNIGWLTVTGAADGYASIFDLTGLFEVAKIDVLQTVTPLLHICGAGSGGSGSAVGSGKEGCNSLRSFIAAHLADEAFVSYPRRFAAKLRPSFDLLPGSLNSGALFIAAELWERGDQSCQLIAAHTGFSLATVRDILRRLTKFGLLFVYRQGRHNYYSLHTNFEEVLDDLRPKLPSFGQGQMLAAKCAGARADYLAKRLHSRLPLDAGERAKLEARRAKYDDLQMTYRDAAAALGLDLSAQLGIPRPTRHRMKIDPIAVFETQHKPLLDTYNRLGAMRHADKVRKLAYVELGADCSEEQYKAMYRQVADRLREAQQAQHRLSRAKLKLETAPLAFAAD